MPKDKLALSLNNLEYQYLNQQTIIKRVNLQITSGERIGIIGPNGAGKTTLFLLMCGILSPTQGEVWLFNQKINPGKFYPDIGLVFQNPDDQLFCSTVREDVAFGPENMGLTPEEIETRVERALNLTGMLHLKDRVPHQLSGGEKCMIAIASVLAMEPKLVLYDEPSANLDLRARRRLIEFLQSAQQTYLIASHDLELILDVCDRVILLHRGEVVADGIPSIIMGNQSLMETHALEVPYSLSEGK
ncbi:energy-coupling factor ABC transporter ATP-binding protein [Gloeocapsa sp. PCC 73106]|uniref:energy-coupling factor ABC transporter ATP-binding protein n=1 Tax=Gloeocapsa sp. PCC 73106 TaxID=102232 RepID=UPI0002ACF1C1|nr:ABC transporter ATP-binding protein [Gloeocapsa sp. PCC 73106]ELR97586.1 ABC-type cobalt transport system, ATPase component [Gloeocapsa sp. PCC 73106]